MCQTCTQLQAAIDRAANNPEKQRIMRILYDQHKAQHQPVQPVVVWKDGTQWQEWQAGR